MRRYRPKFAISGVYQILNLVTGRRYIGSAKFLARREKVHLTKLAESTHWNLYLQAAWAKYGGSAFVFSPIIFCEPSDLLMYEQIAIDFYRASGLYNLAPVAGSQLGFKHTYAAKQKLARAKLGRPLSAEHRRAISLATKGLVKSETHKEALRKAALGYKFNDAARAKMAAAKLGKRQKIEVILNRVRKNTGQRRSPEQIKRLVLGQKRRRERERQVTTLKIEQISERVFL